jgi:NAD(P)-dependent dehydrogenase (short-subunit alcohol dehydrogenase family)
VLAQVESLAAKLPQGFREARGMRFLLCLSRRVLAGTARGCKSRGSTCIMGSAHAPAHALAPCWWTRQRAGASAAQVDILLNNAGLALSTAPVQGTTTGDALGMISTNVSAVVRATPAGLG